MSPISSVAPSRHDDDDDGDVDGGDDDEKELERKLI